MMRAYGKSILINPNCFYFGKIPSRSDFIKSTSGTRVISLMDQWIGHGMEMLMAMPDWKTSFDSAGPFDFFLLGLKRKYAIHGTLAPSRDASARRFPLVAATSFELQDPLQFLRIGSFALDEVCRSRRNLMSHVIESQDTNDVLDLLTSCLSISDCQTEIAEARCADYLANQSLAGLNAMLMPEWGSLTLRQMILSLGSLLLPLRASSAAPAQKAIALPLPKQEAERVEIMALWLQLIAISLNGSAIELSLFSGLHLGQPKLIVAFNGVTPLIFQSLFDEHAAKDFLIDTRYLHWTEQDESMHPLRAVLSSHLKHQEISVQQLVTSFRNAYGK